MYNKRIKRLVDRAIVIGLEVIKINDCITIKQRSDDCILCIPDKVEDLGYNFGSSLYSWFEHSRINSMQVIGDNSLKRTGSMFEECTIKEVILEDFYTGSLIDTSSMFSGSTISKIDLSNFDTSNVNNILHIFNGWIIKSIKIKN